MIRPGVTFVLWLAIAALVLVNNMIGDTVIADSAAAFLMAAGEVDAVFVGADMLVVQGGINDIVQGQPVEPAALHIAAILERGRAAGLALAVAESSGSVDGPCREATARRHGASYRLTGAKSFAIDALAADWLVVAAHDEATGGRAFFLIEAAQGCVQR